MARGFFQYWIFSAAWFKTFSLKLETLNEAASRGNVFASALLAASLFGCGKERVGGAHNNND